MRALLDLTPEEFHAWLLVQGQPPLRARQVRRWLFAGRAESFEQMTDLPLALRQALAAEFQVFGTRVARHLRSSDGTNKLLLRLQDDQLIECVLLQEEDRHTACISTQVGCGMGCVFCASGLAGLERNLTTGEILEQLLRLRNLIPLPPSLPAPLPRSGGEGSTTKTPSPPAPLPRSGGEGSKTLQPPLHFRQHLPRGAVQRQVGGVAGVRLFEVELQHRGPGRLRHLDQPRRRVHDGTGADHQEAVAPLGLAERL